MRKIVLNLIAIVAISVAASLLFNVFFPKEAEVIEKTDTMYVYKTVTIEKPVLKESKVVETMLVAVHDTSVKNDTTFIALPRESKTYGDDRFTAVVSGYKPSLDRLDIYVENQTVTKYLIPEPQKQKMNYLTIGAEAAYVGDFYIPIYLEYERLFHKNFGIYGKIMYDLPSKDIGAGIGVRAKFGW
jgi:hypothetical protein